MNRSTLSLPAFLAVLALPAAAVLVPAAGSLGSWAAGLGRDAAGQPLAPAAAELAPAPRHDMAAMIRAGTPIDFDNDGREDRIITSPEGWVAVLKNLRMNQSGVTQYRDVTNYVFECSERPHSGLRGFAVADFDGDGWPDLFAADGRGCRLYRNTGDHAFADVAADLLPPGATAGCLGGAWGDYDGDGRPDLLLVCTGQAGVGGPLPASRIFAKAVLLRNELAGGGAFVDASFEAGLCGLAVPLGVADGSIAWGDLDLDGDLDFWIGRDRDRRAPGLFSAGAFLNDGNGTFMPAMQVAEAPAPAGWVGW